MKFSTPPRTDLRTPQQVQDLAGIEMGDVLGPTTITVPAGRTSPRAAAAGRRCWRQVHHQLVQLAPGDAGQQLVQHHLDQRRGEGQRLVLAEQEPGPT